VRGRTAIALVSAVVAAAAAAAGSGSAASVFVVSGRGWGHGVGMSQWGAEGYAQHGATWQRILAHYYPGTRLAPAPLSRVRVLLAAGQPEAGVGCAAPLEVLDASGRGRMLKAGTYRVGPALRLPVGHRRIRSRGAHRHHAALRVVTVPLALRPPLVFDCRGASLAVNGRAYRGLLVVRRGGGRLTLVNSLRLDDYVRGVVGGEMPFGWRLAALEAQAVAARSYAVATLKPTAHYDLYPDTRSQMYGGIAYESPRTDLAVERTAGRVLTWNGRVATTFFFSTSGGRTADVRDVWPHAAAAPYLRSVADPYDAGSPHHVWGPLVLSDDRVAAVLHARLDGGVQVGRTGSGRVAYVQLGGRRVDGNSFRRALGLSSTWFTIGRLALVPTPAQVTYGRQVQLVAQVSGVGRARLERRVGAGAWTTLETLDDHARLADQPRGRTLYRLSAPGVAGPVVTVSVAPKLQVVPAESELLSGSVEPRSRGAVTVWRQAAGGWHVVARPELDADGGFRAPLKLRATRYRIAVAADGRFAAATATLQITPRLLASLQQ
jgi:stage II sporulation protein D